ncbi:cytochrome P450 [Loktanella sp. DJP18]|uniref:cytochrome P450 n=1 Tax=Loktanella sp. DJP18 TaxID=3409788 RepID=UPI003BB672F6
MAHLPRDHWPDSTVPLLRDPYRYIGSRSASFGTQGFRTRILGRPAVCLTGAAAAGMFFDPMAFCREGAVPAVVRDVLFGNGGVQGLDGAAHAHRKAMFLALMGPSSDLGQVGSLFDAACRDAAVAWHGRVDLFVELTRVLTRVACAWAGVPLAATHTDKTAGRLADLFLHAGPNPLGQVKARLSRHQLEKDMVKLVNQVRDGTVESAPDQALSFIANWRDLDGALLPAEVAAVELLNMLRPTVAIAVYLVFVADALVHHGGDRGRIAADSAWRQAFVQEVRRTYPFFPATAAIARKDIDWQGERIVAGTRVLMDIYGTNRDAMQWCDAEDFAPARFLDWPGDPFTLIPQGGGAHGVTHRCPANGLPLR